jgi:hypothetical protein
LDWQASVLKAKGASCPFHVRVEITLATFDLWRLLCLQAFIVADANERGAIINKRYRTLPGTHQQYNDIEARFFRRVELLQLDKASAGSLDLVSMLQAAQDGKQA